MSIHLIYIIIVSILITAQYEVAVPMILGKKPKASNFFLTLPTVFMILALILMFDANPVNLFEEILRLISF